MRDIHLQYRERYSYHGLGHEKSADIFHILSLAIYFVAKTVNCERSEPQELVLRLGQYRPSYGNSCPGSKEKILCGKNTIFLELCSGKEK